MICFYNVLLGFFSKLIQVRSTLFKATFAVMGVYWAFYLQRNSLSYIFATQKKILLLGVLILFLTKAYLYFNLGVIHNQMNNFEAAELAFDEAFFLNEEDFEALLGMATLYEQLGDKYFNGTEENFKKDYFQAERWYKKARSKLRSLNEIDTDNQEQ